MFWDENMIFLMGFSVTVGRAVAVGFERWVDRVVGSAVIEAIVGKRMWGDEICVFQNRFLFLAFGGLLAARWQECHGRLDGSSREGGVDSADGRHGSSRWGRWQQPRWGFQGIRWDEI